MSSPEPLDIYATLPPDEAVEARRHNRGRLAELEAQTPGRHERFAAALAATHDHGGNDRIIL